MSAISCVSLTTELTVASAGRGCGQQLDGVAVILSGQSGHGPKHADTFWMSIAESWSISPMLRWKGTLPFKYRDLDPAAAQTW